MKILIAVVLWMAMGAQAAGYMVPVVDTTPRLAWIGLGVALVPIAVAGWLLRRYGWERERVVWMIIALVAAALLIVLGLLVFLPEPVKVW